MWKFFKGKDEEIPDPPYEYEDLLNLSEREYPNYLKKIFKNKTGKELNLKHPKTFNEKIQWIKLYDKNLKKKGELTDKIKVREFVMWKIGENYLKPMLFTCKSFDEIPFFFLPNSFIIKANNGCKWQYKIKDKNKFLSEEKLYLYVRNKFNNWMKQRFCYWAGFEMQYKYIEPQIIIEPVLIDDDRDYAIEYEIYCFNGVPKIYQRVEYDIPVHCCVYEKNYEESKITFNPAYVKYYMEPEQTLIEAVELSKILSKDFNLVRVDWLLYNNNIYFNEMTFTPFSGFYQFADEKMNYRLGKMLKI